ncbi:hypothetical protein BIW11_07239 [Tropilaelaps mercedesae]|uniref:Uncharacterized protein n=1 Tax=Tropilaelaps mercedesae TaxID=418985 RepID=A0A1V9XUX8_9ACAR|nr:hypothetical protein BIW11_07239 [Tropilaelaps mercedesae]
MMKCPLSFGIRTTQLRPSILQMLAKQAYERHIILLLTG